MNNEGALAHNRAEAYDFKEINKVLNQRKLDTIADKEAVFGENARLAEIEDANLLRVKKSIASESTTVRLEDLSLCGDHARRRV
jgi:hypothetical protein